MEHAHLTPEHRNDDEDRATRCRGAAAAAASGNGGGPVRSGGCRRAGPPAELDQLDGGGSAEGLRAEPHPSAGDEPDQGAADGHPRQVSRLPATVAAAWPVGLSARCPSYSATWLVGLGHMSRRSRPHSLSVSATWLVGLGHMARRSRSDLTNYHTGPHRATLDHFICIYKTV